jgi:hypothetical protein
VLIAIATIRIRRQDLSGDVPAPPEPAPQSETVQPETVQPETVQPHEERVALAAASRPCRFC